MKKSDFYYDLPENLIAQSPIEPRDSSRLLVADKATGEFRHAHFYDLPNYLQKGDLLILNDSKVFPARLNPLNFTGEVLLLEQINSTTWECIGKGLKQGREIVFADFLKGKITEILPNGNRLIEFDFTGDFFAILEKVGETPLPHYITQKLDQPARYNTIYADECKRGSAAAPTAGLHFTERTFADLQLKGVDTAHVTLHVGLGTFRPVKTDDISAHQMHSERYSLPPDTAAKINACRARGGRIIAAGTTSCRVLESVARELISPNSPITAASGTTDIFIHPGYNFKLIDALLTNFHLPESTLIMLVSGFLGRERTLAAYSAAIDAGYRFFSFGDAMLVV
ncbi:MAG: tRNA preQ1(34) S-adenosylmethionine ribosyltransferase-isomerase QueA [Oscillospiraceae bacterium]|nr:tRNA preQ1(34) S-adenosylmethionine ribosyltransferase-isomerase QueA [Oscillospiraceae bacterium]